MHPDIFSSTLSVQESTILKQEIKEEQKESHSEKEELIKKESLTARLTDSSSNVNRTEPRVRANTKVTNNTEGSQVEYINKFAGWIETFSLKMQDIENEHELLQIRCKEITTLQKESINKSVLPKLTLLVADYLQFKKLEENELNQFDAFDKYMQTTIASMASDISSINKTKKGAKVAGFTLASLSLLLIPVSIPVVIGTVLMGVGAATISSKESKKSENVTLEMKKASLFEEAFKEKKQLISECKSVISSYIDHLINIKNDLESDTPIKDADLEYIKMYTPLKPEDLIVQKLA